MRCPSCNAELKKEMNFCPNCGRKIQREIKMRNHATLLIVMVFVIIIGCSLLVAKLASPAGVTSIDDSVQILNTNLEGIWADHPDYSSDEFGVIF